MLSSIIPRLFSSERFEMIRKLGLVTIGCTMLGSLYAEPAKKDMQAEVAKKTEVKKNLNVAYVDSLNAMRDSKAGQIVTADLEAKRKKMAEELQKCERQFAQEFKEFQEKVSTMSEDAREREQKRLAKLERDFKIKAQEFEEELKLEMQKATEKLSKELDDAVYEYARAANLDVVIDRVTGRVIYSAADQEPTQQVVSIMNKNHDNRVALEGKKSTSVAKADKKQAPAA